MEKTIVVYGVDWCGDCLRTRRFLNNNKVNYTFINIDQNTEAEQFVLVTNKGMRSVPTIVFDDGSILVEPRTSTLAEKLGILYSN
jgi:mycoredoxin